MPAERRHELALLLCLGFRPRALLLLLLGENGLLLASGLVIGAGAALVGAVPQMLAADTAANWLEVAGTVAALLVAGLAILYLAARAGLRIQPVRDLQRGE